MLKVENLSAACGIKAVKNVSLKSKKEVVSVLERTGRENDSA